MSYQQGFNAAAVPVQPINSLNPFSGGKQWIKARVIDKSDVKTWNKPNSTGKLFSCTLVDESASIRATFFNEGVDMFHPLLQNGQVYYIGGGSIKNANRKFSNVNNEYEITMDKDTQVHAARDAAANIPMQRYNFVPVEALTKKEENSPVDLLVVVTKVGPIAKIVSKKDGKELIKRDVTLADQTNSVDCTFWEEDANKFNYDVGAVLAMKNVKVRTYNGVTVGYNQGSSIDANPQISDTVVLQKWFQATGGLVAKTLSTYGREGDALIRLGRRYFRSIEAEGLGKSEKADLIEVVCTPTFIKTESVWYDACPGCNKKVTPMNDNLSRCEKCNQTVKSEPRYLCSIQCSDGVSSAWLTLFNESGDVFWGHTAKELKAKSIENSSFLTTCAQSRLHKPLLLSIRVKEEAGRQGTDGTSYEDRVRLTVSKVQSFLFPDPEASANILKECEHLIATINSYN